MICDTQLLKVQDEVQMYQ